MRFRTLSGAIPNPAAGQGFTYQFSPIERVKLHSLVFTFTTDVVVANRLVSLVLIDPNNVPVFETGSSTAVAASAAVDYVVSPIFSQPAAMQGPVNPAVGLAFPGFWLPPAWKVKVAAAAMDVADTFTGITFAAHYSEDVWHQNQDAAAWAAAIAALGS